MRTYWISKTVGQVREARVRPGRATRGDRVDLGTEFVDPYTIGKDCWPTREEAVADAERRRQARIETLRRQADAIEATPIAVHALERARA